MTRHKRRINSVLAVSLFAWAAVAVAALFVKAAAVGPASVWGAVRDAAVHPAAMAVNLAPSTRD